MIVETSQRSDILTEVVRTSKRETLTLFDNPELNIFETQARPLTAEEIVTVKRKLVPEDRAPALEAICQANHALFDSSKSIGIVLDGRSDFSTQGWLGDMIEASRLIKSLVLAGKEVVVITSQPDLFDSMPGVQTLGIPREIDSKALRPYNESLLKFSQGHADAFIFPISAYLPVLLEIQADGTLGNQATVDAFKRTLDPTGKTHGISVERWGEQNIHQLQALQVFSEIVGIDNAKGWDAFPSAYIHPDSNSQFIATQVIQNCKEQSKTKPNEKAFPLFIHMGVATDHGKIDTKFYPEQKWVEFLAALAHESVPISELFFFKPFSPEQQAATKRIVEIARDLQYQVTEIPISEIEAQYGWTLGAFASFLTYILEEKGVIVGVDSMPTGHLAPAMNIPSVVLGNKIFAPSFFCPPDNALVVMPTNQPFTATIEPERVAAAVRLMAEKKLTS